MRKFIGTTIAVAALAAVMAPLGSSHATVSAIQPQCKLLTSQSTTYVLRVPNDDGAYCISLCDEPDPCRPETATFHPGESIADELRRRGGVVRPAADLLAQTRPPTNT